MNRLLNIPVEERAVVNAYPYIDDECVATQNHLDKGFIRVVGGLGGGVLALTIGSGIEEMFHDLTNGSVVTETVFNTAGIGTVIGTTYVFGSGVKRMLESAIAVRRISRGTKIATKHSRRA